MVVFSASPRDRRLINSITNRAVKLLKGHGEKADKQMIAMDITATHRNGTPLQLERLLIADSFSFAHDVFGIRRHLDRSTGKLTGGFRPRFAARKEEQDGV